MEPPLVSGPPNWTFSGRCTPTLLTPYRGGSSSIRSTSRVAPCPSLRPLPSSQSFLPNHYDLGVPGLLSHSSGVPPPTQGLLRRKGSTSSVLRAFRTKPTTSPTQPSVSSPTPLSSRLRPVNGSLPGVVDTGPSPVSLPSTFRSSSATPRNHHPPSPTSYPLPLRTPYPFPSLTPYPTDPPSPPLSACRPSSSTSHPRPSR